MPKCYLDSNVLIYWDNKTSIKHQASLQIIQKLEKSGIVPVISSLVLDEFLHAIALEARKHKTADVYNAARESLDNLLQLPSLYLINPPTDTDKQQEVVNLMEKFSLRPRDAYHLLTMQANEIDSFATFDTDFTAVFAAKILTKV